MNRPADEKLFEPSRVLEKGKVGREVPAELERYGPAGIVRHFFILYRGARAGVPLVAAWWLSVGIVPEQW